MKCTKLQTLLVHCLEPAILIVMVTRSREAFDKIVKKENDVEFIYHERKSLR